MDQVYAAQNVGNTIRAQSIICDSMMCNGTVMANDFSGPLIPLGPVEFPALNDSSGYADYTACVSGHGGFSINKRLNARQIFVDSLDNTEFVPDVGSDDLVVRVADSDGSGGIMVSNNVAAPSLTGKLSFANQGAIKGGITFTHDATAPTSQHMLLYANGNTGVGVDLQTHGASQSTVNVKTAQLVVEATSNQVMLGDPSAFHTTISSVAPAANRVITIPDPGTASSFILADSAQLVNGIKSFTSPVLTDQITTYSSGFVQMNSTVKVDSVEETTGGHGIFVGSALRFNSPLTNQIVFNNFSAHQIFLNVPVPTVSYVATIPDVGGDADFIMSTGAQTKNGVLTLPNGIVLTGGSILDKYVKDGTATVAFSGAASFNSTGRWTITGTSCTLILQSGVVYAEAAATILTATLPAAIQPSASATGGAAVNLTLPTLVYDNSALVSGSARIYPATHGTKPGVIELYVGSASNFANAGNCGFDSISFTYLL